MKRFLSVLMCLSFFLTVSFCTSFCSSAAFTDTVDSVPCIDLPFPNPASFGNCCAVVFSGVWANGGTVTTHMYVFKLVSSNIFENNVTFNVFLYPSQYKMTFTGVSGTSSDTIIMYHFSYTNGHTDFTLQQNSFPIHTSTTRTYTPFASGTMEGFYFYSFSPQYNFAYDADGNHTVNYQYSFANEFSKSQVDTLLGDTASIVVKLDDIIDLLGGDPSSAPTTTENSQISDYDDVEGAILNDSFDKLTDFTTPNLSDFSSGGFGNSFQFLKTSIENFSGFSANSSDTSLNKLAACISVILTIGLLSFVFRLRSKG